MTPLHKYILTQKRLFIPYFQSISKITDWLNQKHYSSKQARLNVVKTYANIPHIVCKIWEHCLNNEFSTYQQICGELNYLIKNMFIFNRIKTIAEIIAICSDAELITIEKVKDKFWVYTEYKPTDLILRYNKHKIRFTKPNITKPMLGNEFKQTKQPCIDHLQRVNAIRLKIDQSFVNTYPELPKHEIKDPQELANWASFVSKSKEIYKEIQNRYIYFENKYDTRGRCYAVGYYINPQGTAYKKAMLQFNKQEVLLKGDTYV